MFVMISFDILLCEHVGLHLFSHSRTSNCCYLVFDLSFANWMDKNA